MATAPKMYGKKIERKKRRNTRLSPNKIGYDKKWEKLRAAYISESPICEHCASRGITTGPKESRLEVDHIIPFHGIDDPLRLDWGNLQTLCRRCHAIKTEGDKKNGVE